MFREREELFATLVFEMGQVLKYKFDRTYVRDNIYRPQFHVDVEKTELETRKMIHSLLQSEALPVRFVPHGEGSQPSAAAIVESADASVLPKSH